MVNARAIMQCPKCKRNFHAADGFYRDQKRVTGYRATCKFCEIKRKMELAGMVGGKTAVEIQESKKVVKHKGHKTCPMCNKVLGLKAFHRNKKMKDGRQSYCKKCVADYCKLRRRFPAAAVYPTVNMRKAAKAYKTGDVVKQKASHKSNELIIRIIVSSDHKG